MNTHAQNWKTVLLSDTVYFRGGKSVYNSGYNLRVIWVTRSEAVGQDSIFHFYPGILDTSVNGARCLDTLGPTWLGRKFVRNDDGTEYYFNGIDDTIILHTNAPLNHTWRLATDTSGRVFMATVLAIDTQSIDGIADSVKTIGIQAYRNNVAVTHHYNNLTLQISKHHGWIKALDFYVFPNAGYVWWKSYVGLRSDTSQHYRLGREFSRTALGHIDLAWKYAPGNEWIKQTKVSGSHPSVPPDETLIHDSVASVTYVNAQEIIVEIHTIQYSIDWTMRGMPGQYPPESKVSASRSVSTHTFHSGNSVGSRTIADLPYPEYAETGNAYSRYFNTCSIDSFCGRYILKPSGRGIGNQYHRAGTNCWKHEIGSPGGSSYEEQHYLPGFGFFRSYSSESEGFITNYHLITYSYIKLGDCEYGSKQDLRALGVDHQNAGLSSDTSPYLYPNPTRDHVWVSIPSNGSNGQSMVVLRDVSGRLVSQEVCKGSSLRISLVGVPSGMYIVEITAGMATHQYKLIVVP